MPGCSCGEFHRLRPIAATASDATASIAGSPSSIRKLPTPVLRPSPGGAAAATATGVLGAAAVALARQQFSVRSPRRALWQRRFHAALRRPGASCLAEQNAWASEKLGEYPPATDTSDPLRSSDQFEHSVYCPPPAPAAPANDWDDWDEWEFPEMWDLALEHDDCTKRLDDMARSGDWEGAVKLLEQMRHYGTSPSVGDYRYALRACRHASQCGPACEFIEKMWATDLDPDTASYGSAIAACARAGEHSRAEELEAELQSWGESPHHVRFHLVPKISWNRLLRSVGCGIRNTFTWSGALPPPLPPSEQCWLIPSQDDAAVQVAEMSAELAASGWRIFSCDPQLVDCLRNKASLRFRAEKLGLAALLPEHFDDIATARYPCVLKPAVGTYGKDTHIVCCPKDATSVAADGLGTTWVLQELVSGHFEYSTSLLVMDGEVLDSICIRYQYDRDEYVWPNVEELATAFCSVSAEHLASMQTLLRGYTGICNLNYKLRGDGSLCIFEVNPRVGGDLVFDVPRPRARAFFEKLDFLGSIAVAAPKSPAQAFLDEIELFGPTSDEEAYGQTSFDTWAQDDLY